jgi:biotin synthase
MDFQRRLHECFTSPRPSLDLLRELLATEDSHQLEQLFAFANDVRKHEVGDGIFLRGIIEFSSHCRNRCAYCGLNSDNKTLARYRLSHEELLAAVDHVVDNRIRTIVLQSGEEDDLDPDWLATAIRNIKAKHDIAITLSVGERSRHEYNLWRQAGADRYLLKIETSDPRLYEALHSGMDWHRRDECAGHLKGLGYQVGSGVIVGLPGQTSETLAGDLLYFSERQFDMIGIGPFIPHCETVLKNDRPGTVLATLKMVALTRIITKNAHLPATTALGSIEGGDHRIKALKAGANVLMPNFTPQPYRKMYEIYPNKRCIDEPVGACGFCMEGMANSIGRFIDYAKGDAWRLPLSQLGPWL